MGGLANKVYIPGGLLMPLFLIIILAIIAIVFFLIHAIKNGKATWIQKEWINVIVFIISLVSLIISLVLMVNMAIYADEYASSPVRVTGGWFWLNMYWLRLGLLFVLCLISGLKLVPRRK